MQSRTLSLSVSSARVKALRRAIQDVFGEHALVHRCHRHKERNVCDLLPERDRDQVRARIRAAWSLTDPGLARDRLQLLASELDRTWPDAAASLREGLEDLLTVKELRLGGSKLERILSTTNLIENLIGLVRQLSGRVKRWRSGKMILRWSAAGVLEAEHSFRRIKGYQEMNKLNAALQKHEEKLNGIAFESAVAVA
jgi:transposase-like protein